MAPSQRSVAWRRLDVARRSTGTKARLPADVKKQAERLESLCV